jgi:antitoxin MazE
MKTRIIRIGNSQGIRIPKPLLEQTGLRGEIEIEVRGDGIVLRPLNSPRAGWPAAFRAMAEHGEDALLDSTVPPSRWDEEEWRWP